MNDLYSSPNIIRVIKPSRMRWAWHVAHVGSRSDVYSVFFGNLRERTAWKTQA